MATTKQKITTKGLGNAIVQPGGGITSPHQAAAAPILFTITQNGVLIPSGNSPRPDTLKRLTDINMLRCSGDVLISPNDVADIQKTVAGEYNVLIGQTLQSVRPINDVLRRSSNVLRRSSNVLGRSNNVLRASSNVLGRSNNVLGRSSNVLGRSSNVLRASSNVLGASNNVLRTSSNVLRRSSNVLAPSGNSLRPDAWKRLTDIGMFRYSNDVVLSSFGLTDFPITGFFSSNHIFYQKKQ